MPSTQEFIWWLLSKVVGGPRAARFLGVTVGTDCRVYTGRFGSEPWLIAMGDRVTVTAGVSFLTHDGATWLLRDSAGRRFQYAPITIGSDVFIGVNAILLPGVRIGSRVIIGAGSVVTKSVPNGCVIAGNPARVIGSFDDYARRGLSTLPTRDQMDGATYKARVMSVVTPEHRSFVDRSPLTRRKLP